MKVDRDKPQPRHARNVPAYGAHQAIALSDEIGPDLVLTYEPDVVTARVPAPGMKHQVLRGAVVAFFVALAAVCGMALG